MVADHDKHPYSSKRAGKLIKFHSLPSMISSGIKESEVMFYLNKVAWTLIDSFAIHKVHAYGWTPGCKTQLGNNLNLNFVPNRKKNKYLVEFDWKSNSS